MTAKRIFDLTVASLALLLLSPLLLGIAFLVRLTSRGPVFHRAERVGRGGRLFRLYKFRSMRVGIPGPAITGASDPRVTPLGRWLRRWKLDELPQLFNVVSGEMSLVGPRPEDPVYVARYTPKQRFLLSFRPGITSEGSVRFRHEEQLLEGPNWEEKYRTVVLPEKLRIELEYLRHRTFLTDLRVLLRTAIQVLRPSRT